MENKLLNNNKPYRANWKKLLCEERRRQSSYEKDRLDSRNAFDNDYNRIIFSSAFRRLQDKAQVFPLEDSDFVRTRLTHSIEVSTIAESIGVSLEEFLVRDDKAKEDGFTSEMKGQLRKLLACSGLLHDIGNTPFGHFGEFSVQQYFKERDKEKKLENLSEEERKDYICFDGNAQALRIISKLQSMGNEAGMNLCYATLSSIIKYPRSSTEGNLENGKISFKKYGYLQSEKEIFSEIVDKTGLKNGSSIIRNPIVYILEAADDIAYCVSDVEDGFKKGLLSIEYLKEKILDVFYKKYMISDDSLTQENLKKIDKTYQDDSTYNEIKSKGSEKERILYASLGDREKNIIGAFYNQITFGDKEDNFIRAQKLRVAIQAFMITSAVEEFKKEYDLIMSGEYEEDLLLQSDAKQLRIALKEITIEKIFNNKEMLKNELAGEKVITRLLELFIDSVSNMNSNGEFKDKKSERLYNIISDNYKKIYENNTDKSPYNKVQLVVDFISGMTDSYALELYKQLQGIII